MTRISRLLRVSALALAGLATVAPAAPPRGEQTSGSVLSTAPVVAEPVLGRLRVFDNWAVGCDNRLSCSAVSLNPEGVDTPNRLLVLIHRDGGPPGATSLRVLLADRLRDRVDFMIDGTRRVRQKVDGDTIALDGQTALEVVRSMGSSYVFELYDRNRTVIGAPSLQGVAAALRYMDEQQGRIGSRGALAAIGDGPADMARALPADPVLPKTIPLLAETATPALTPQEQATAQRLAQCESGLESSRQPDLHTLDAGHVLLLLPCDAGAYNVSAVPLIASGEPGNRTIAFAPFDHLPGFTGDASAPPLIMNARWNPSRGELSSFAKGRGLGDCGTAETYRWDGTRFRLTEARSMPVCRGAWEWPVLFSLKEETATGRP
ncbi:hypothetical protein M2333_002134 [Sphingobium sp. B11D3B]|uniref:DUF1176 domain-containing protein n=1 Tax=Sphingobium sp. B11D3B TaxID=2940575 RepID=UPI002227DD73|nr:DUF1176 domain-containing protein [Sphingobium sp. B11D3B]MCW2389088.1 hypothetical protein [Sphingobium sp. B11D3B]